MTNNAPRHAPKDYFPIENGQLILGNMPLEQLAQRIGRTPFYAYDRQAMSNRVSQLRQCMPQALKIHYAMKANPMPAVVQHMATLVDGFDLLSGIRMRFSDESEVRTEKAVDHVAQGHEIRTVANGKPVVQFPA